MHLIELFNRNIETIEAGTGVEFVLLFLTLIRIIGALIISFVINWYLSLILLCLVISIFVVSFALSKVMMIVESIYLSNYDRLLLMKLRTC